MKYDAITQSGIKIINRYDIPEHLIPPDSQVEVSVRFPSIFPVSRFPPSNADIPRHLLSD